VRRFRFRLDRLLELRSFKERRAELVLAERAGLCALLEARIAENLERRARNSRDMFAPGRELSDYRAAELYQRRLEAERERLSRELVVAELAREAAKAEYLAKRRDREVVDKLRERKETEYYRLAELEETKELDDLARRPGRAGLQKAGQATSAEAGSARPFVDLAGAGRS
jgi:flagellar FliJ protein